MSLTEAAFWVGITVFGTGLYFMFEAKTKKDKKRLGLVMTCIGSLVVVVCIGRHVENTFAAQSQNVPSQQNIQAGNDNNAGNVNQNGDNNTAVIGNNNKITTNKITDPQLSDWLVPGHSQAPKTDCPQRIPDAFMFVYGDSVSYIPKKDQSFPHTVIEVDAQPKLVLNKDKRGRLALSVDVYDDRGYIVAQIENNRFTVNKNNYFKLEKTPSTLVVFDQRNQKVLDFRFLNPSAIQIEATLRFPELEEPLVLASKGNNLSGLDFQQACANGTIVDVYLPATRAVSRH